MSGEIMSVLCLSLNHLLSRKKGLIWKDRWIGVGGKEHLFFIFESVMELREEIRHRDKWLNWKTKIVDKSQPDDHQKVLCAHE